ncbi:MAG: chemotaxis protein CheV [Nitrospirae bacterium]|nr:chemotaxis protein CheV [Nitrospirota bacterium]
MKDQLFSEVERRTSLALSNQMEMLVFFLNDGQRYGINVFKIVEVIECPHTITRLPHSHPSIKGTIDFRGKAVAIIDLAEFLAMPPQEYKTGVSYVIVSEYNNNVQGFLVHTPDNLITRNWEDIKSPTGMLANTGFLIAIAHTDDGEIIQLLDIERILGDIIGVADVLSEEIVRESKNAGIERYHVMVIDDSKAARTLTKTVLEQMGVRYTIMDNAISALQLLEKDADLRRSLTMIISDIEMPGMDGFTFTRKVRENPVLKDFYVMLHSSMSNPSNQSKAEQVGADVFVGKFKPDEVALNILNTIKEIDAKRREIEDSVRRR